MSQDETTESWLLATPKVSLLETTCPGELRLACSGNCLSTLLLWVKAGREEARTSAPQLSGFP